MNNPAWLLFVLLTILLWSATSLLYKAGARGMFRNGSGRR